MDCTHSRRSLSLPTTTTTGMDAGAKKLLETATIETLHANGFSRASTQATQVLTDLLSRYLSLLAATCAKYAEHAGRLRLSARDTVSALGELGLDVQELSEYVATEGRELARYARHSTRRVEDLNEFKGQSRRGSCVLLSFDALFMQLRWLSACGRTRTTRFLSCMRPGRPQGPRMMSMMRVRAARRRRNRRRDPAGGPSRQTECMTRKIRMLRCFRSRRTVWCRVHDQ